MRLLSTFRVIALNPRCRLNSTAAKQPQPGTDSRVDYCRVGGWYDVASGRDFVLPIDPCHTGLFDETAHRDAQCPDRTFPADLLDECKLGELVLSRCAIRQTQAPLPSPRVRDRAGYIRRGRIEIGNRLGSNHHPAHLARRAANCIDHALPKSPEFAKKIGASKRSRRSPGICSASGYLVRSWYPSHRAPAEDRHVGVPGPPQKRGDRKCHRNANAPQAQFES